MSRDQYSHMRQQFCGVNDYCDAHGSIYPKIKIMAVWRQIHHAGHTPPRNHDLPHWCDFPDEYYHTYFSSPTNVVQSDKCHYTLVLKYSASHVEKENLPMQHPVQFTANYL